MKSSVAKGDSGDKKPATVEQSGDKRSTEKGKGGDKRSTEKGKGGDKRSVTVEQRGGGKSTDMAQRGGGGKSTDMAQRGDKKSATVEQSGVKKSSEMAQRSDKRSITVEQRDGGKSTDMAQRGDKKPATVEHSGVKKSSEMAQRSNKKSITRDIKKWLRIIHRYLGFLMVGISLIYGISGIILNHMGMSDPAYHSINSSINLEAGLSVDQVDAAWQKMADDLPVLKQVFEQDSINYIVMIDGGVGYYNKISGKLEYEHHTKREFVYWINKLHYNKVDGWSFMADFFAGALIFFAISGMFMVSKKHSLRGRGKWYVIAGLLIPILFIVLS